MALRDRDMLVVDGNSEVDPDLPEMPSYPHQLDPDEAGAEAEAEFSELFDEEVVDGVVVNEINDSSPKTPVHVDANASSTSTTEDASVKSSITASRDGSRNKPKVTKDSKVNSKAPMPKWIKFGVFPFVGLIVVLMATSVALKQFSQAGGDDFADLDAAAVTEHSASENVAVNIPQPKTPNEELAREQEPIMPAPTNERADPVDADAQQGKKHSKVILAEEFAAMSRQMSDMKEQLSAALTRQKQLEVANQDLSVKLEQSRGQNEELEQKLAEMNHPDKSGKASASEKSSRAENDAATKKSTVIKDTKTNVAEKKSSSVRTAKRSWKPYVAGANKKSSQSIVYKKPDVSPSSVNTTSGLVPQYELISTINGSAVLKNSLTGKTERFTAGQSVTGIGAITSISNEGCAEFATGKKIGNCN